MSINVQPVLRENKDRIVFREWNHLTGCMPVFLLFFLTGVLMAVFVVISSKPGIDAGGGNALVLLFILLAILCVIILPYFGGFAINRVTKEVRRLGIPLFAPKPFSFEDARGIGLRRQMRRVLIHRRHSDTDNEGLYEYFLFFPMGNGIEHQLYCVAEKDLAFQVQKELAEHLQLEALPLEGAAPQP